MAEFANFAIFSPSRHPGNQNAYDAGHHRYKATYVKPRSWDLALTFSPQGILEVSEGRIELPAVIKSYAWSIHQVGGSFSDSIAGREADSVRAWPMLVSHAQVPRPGNYEITLRVVLKDGSEQSNTRSYLLRDLLIVGLGDSFASGQGNPDYQAVPSPDQALACKATTVALLVRKAEAFITELRAALKRKGKDIIEYISLRWQALGRWN